MRDITRDQTLIREAMAICLASQKPTVTAFLAECTARGIPSTTVYRKYGDLAAEFNRLRATPATPTAEANALREECERLTQRDRERLARIRALEQDCDALLAKAQLLHAENAELRSAAEQDRPARVVPLDRIITRDDITAHSWEQLRADYLALIREHAELKADHARTKAALRKTVQTTAK